MVNAIHLKKIRDGHKAWNSWREENSDVTPDLTGADLTDIDLSQYNLSFAKIEGAKFDIKNLSFTNFMDSKSVQGLAALKRALS